MSEFPQDFEAKLASRESMASLSLPSTLNVDITSPCVKSQVVQLNSSGTLYSGTTGDFDLIVLASINDGGTTTWEMITYDSETGSGCIGRRVWRRDPADTDPVGSYCRFINGALDCNAGTGDVS